MPTVIAAPIPDELARRTIDFVTTVREAERPSKHRKAGIGIINELTVAGLNGFFLASSRELGFGMVARGTVRVGLGTASRGIAVVVRSFVGKFDDDQMRKTVDILERILIVE